MTIIEALKKLDGLRIDNGGKWLLFDGEEWVVFQKKRHAKYARVLIKTDSEDEAIKHLIYDIE